MSCNHDIRHFNESKDQYQCDCGKLFVTKKHLIDLQGSFGKERRRSLMDDRELNHEIEILEGDLRLLANKIRALQDRLFDLKKERENRLYRIEGRHGQSSL